MKAKGVVAVLAGQASIVAILVLVLVLSLAGAPLLQQKKIVAESQFRGRGFGGRPRKFFQPGTEVLTRHGDHFERHQ